MPFQPVKCCLQNERFRAEVHLFKTNEGRMCKIFHNVLTLEEKISSLSLQSLPQRHPNITLTGTKKIVLVEPLCIFFAFLLLFKNCL